MLQNSLLLVAQAPGMFSPGIMGEVRQNALDRLALPQSGHTLVIEKSSPLGNGTGAKAEFIGANTCPSVQISSKYPTLWNVAQKVHQTFDQIEAENPQLGSDNGRSWGVVHTGDTVYTANCAPKVNVSQQATGSGGESSGPTTLPDYVAVPVGGGILVVLGLIGRAALKKIKIIKYN